MRLNLTFHPKWYYKFAKVSFDSAFFLDPIERIERDFVMCLFLHENLPSLMPTPPQRRSLLGSNLIACGYLFSQIAGCEVIFLPDDSPQVVCGKVDIDRAIEMTDIVLKDNPIWKAIVNQTEQLCTVYGYYLPFINLMGVQNIALDLMGEELFLAYYTEPDSVKILLKNITNILKEAGLFFSKQNKNISFGVSNSSQFFSNVGFITSNCSVNLISNDLYRNFLLPCDIELSKTFSGFGIHHCGSNMERYIDSYLLIEDLAFIEIGYGSDYRAVIEKCRNKNISLRYSAVKLANTDIDTIAEELETMLKFAHDSGADIALSCVGIDDTVSVEKAEKFIKLCTK